MYDELVKRLRNRRICIQQLGTLNDYPLLGEAADAIEELTGFVQEAERDRDEYRERLDKANDAIEELMRRCEQFQYMPPPAWIPVTERLPEVGERVLCYCRANIYEVLTMRTDGSWVHDDKVYDSAYMSGFVTHWMPLPQPPKEE